MSFSGFDACTGRRWWIALALLPILVLVVGLFQHQGGPLPLLLPNVKAGAWLELRGLNATLKAIQAELELANQRTEEGRKQMVGTLDSLRGDIQELLKESDVDRWQELGAAIGKMEDELQSLRQDTKQAITHAQATATQQKAREDENVATPTGSPLSHAASYKFVNYVGEDSQITVRSCNQAVNTRPVRPLLRKHKIAAMLPYLNEQDILYVRLLEQYDVVDFFIVIESPFTYSGLPKPLHFHDQICKRFAEFTPKLVHVVENNTAQLQSMGTWDRESESRNVGTKITQLLRMEPDDLLLESDIDEIVTAAALRAGAAHIWDALSMGSGASIPIVSYNLTLYYCSLYHQMGFWPGWVMLAPKKLLSTCSIQCMRTSRPAISGTEARTMDNAGVHAGYFMPPELISLKIKSFSHQEYDSPEFTDIAAIKRRIRQNEDLYGRQESNFILTRRDPVKDTTIAGFLLEARQALLDLSEKLKILQESG